MPNQAITGDVKSKFMGKLRQQVKIRATLILWKIQSSDMTGDLRE